MIAKEAFDDHGHLQPGWSAAEVAARVLEEELASNGAIIEPGARLLLAVALREHGSGGTWRLYRGTLLAVGAEEAGDLADQAAEGRVMTRLSGPEFDNSKGDGHMPKQAKATKRADLHKGLALTAIESATRAIQGGDWVKARESIEVALITTEAALKATEAV